MPFQKKRRNWRDIRPRNLRDSFRLCKDHAKERKNLSVERIADLIGISDDLLYKWLSNGQMKASLIPSFENACGIHFVTEYLAAGAGRIVINIPLGRRADELALAELQALCAEAVAKLIRFYHDDLGDAEDTREYLTNALQGLAWHRENVDKLDMPELDLGGEGP